MASISLRISQSLDVETSLKIAVEGARNFLDCDRALIYQFQPDMNGTIVAESVLGSWSVGLGAEIKDTCFANQGAKRYHRGHKTVIDNIHTAGLTPCHIKMLEQFQVRANLVVPILLQPSEASPQTTLWGLLIAHHCRQTRTWQSNELNLLDDLSVQLAIAIQQLRPCASHRLKARPKRRRLPAPRHMGAHRHSVRPARQPFGKFSGCGVAGTVIDAYDLEIDPVQRSMNFFKKRQDVAFFIVERDQD